jgi:hypothetical protein
MAECTVPAETARERTSVRIASRRLKSDPKQQESRYHAATFWIIPAATPPSRHAAVRSDWNSRPVDQVCGLAEVQPINGQSHREAISTHTRAIHFGFGSL